MDGLDVDTKSEILDIPKQIKANGSFDKFRKDCFNEVTSQPGFRNLQKQVEDFVLKFLRDQKPNSKKSLVREKLRRTLNENFFLTNGIDKLIETFVEPKLDSTFKPLIHDMVSSTKSPITPALHATPLASTASAQETAMDTSDSRSQQPQKISVEDFIPTTVTTMITTTPKLGHQMSLPAKLKSYKSMDKTPTGNLSEKAQTNKKRPLNISESTEKKKSTTLPVVKAKTPSTSDAKTRTTTFNDAPLEADPTNEYKFNWFATNCIIESIDYDAFFINYAIDPSELSELEELNRI